MVNTHLLCARMLSLLAAPLLTNGRRKRNVRVRRDGALQPVLVDVLICKLKARRGCKVVYTQRLIVDKSESHLAERDTRASVNLVSSRLTILAGETICKVRPIYVDLPGFVLVVREVQQDVFSGPF